MKTRHLVLADNLTVPDLTTEALGIIGKRGSGKTHTAVILVEELLELEKQVVVLDPLGGFWGLRAGSNGKKSGGFPVPIFGGLHGDLPIQDSAGALLADYVVENRLSAIFDLSGFSKSGMRRFVRDFSERFYQLKNKQREPVHVIIDECDLFVPQRIDSKDMLPLVGAVSDLVLRGRSRGIGVTLISQRPARIAKDVLTQVEILIAFRLTGPQDINAFGEWIEHNGTKEEQKKVLETLSSLERGTGWFWAPGLMNGLLKCVVFRPRMTFDSSSTPDGRKVKPPKTLADVDLKLLDASMEKAVEEAKANDPKALKAEIMRLKKELEAAKVKKIQADVAPPKLPARVIPKKDLAAVEKALERATAYTRIIEALMKKQRADDEKHAAGVKRRADLIDQWSQRAQALVSELGNLGTQLSKVTRGEEKKEEKKEKKREKESLPTSASVQYVEPEVNNDLVGKLGKGERKVAIAIAQNGDRGVTRSQLTQVTGYKRSTRNEYIKRLVSAGIVVELKDDDLHITEAGEAWLGDDYEELPTGDALFRKMLKDLPSGEAKILQYVVDERRNSLDDERWISREIIGEACKFARSTRNEYIKRLLARKLLEENSSGDVAAAEILFDDEKKK